MGTRSLLRINRTQGIGTGDALVLRQKLITHNQWSRCTRCSIGVYADRHVLGCGVIPCDVLFLGEAPGKTEDVVGKPFVGRAGKVLDAMIKQAKHVVPFTYAISNMLACRPTDFLGGPNRTPRLEEIDACTTRVAQLLKMCQPQAVILLGKTAHTNVQHLMRWYSYPTFRLHHPAYVLRRGGVESSLADRQTEQLIIFLRETLK